MIEVAFALSVVITEGARADITKHFLYDQGVAHVIHRAL